jgi:3-hydroxyisobutyrate dehydrogenase-like beta-hydroxyacid dehydrogenase
MKIGFIGAGTVAKTIAKHAEDRPFRRLPELLARARVAS